MMNIFSVLRKKVSGEKSVIKNTKNKLHDSIAFVVILAQCFALMPVHNIKNSNVNEIKFKWFSLKLFYSLANMAGAITLVVMNFIRYLSTGMHFGDLGIKEFESVLKLYTESAKCVQGSGGLRAVTVIYFSITILTIILFIRLGYKWHDLNEKWSLVEDTMQHYEYQPNLTKRFIITTCLVMFLALGEHILFILKIANLLSSCDLFYSQPLKTYFGAAFSQIFALTSYSHLKAFVLEYHNILATFAWNFMDLFIMLMCASLAEKFKQINKRVDTTLIHNEDFWKEIREDYNRLTILCKSLDESINHIVSLSFLNNLFFICIQLFRTLEPITGAIIHSIYFVCSFGFLLGRAGAVCIYAAWINDESKGFLKSLFNVSSHDFGPEANRLIHQISSYPVAITGSNYFEINRDLCLKVAGSIITFELILQQVGPMLLNTDDKTDNKPFCLGLE